MKPQKEYDYIVVSTNHLEADQWLFERIQHLWWKNMLHDLFHLSKCCNYHLLYEIVRKSEYENCRMLAHKSMDTENKFPSPYLALKTTVLIIENITFYMDMLNCLKVFIHTINNKNNELVPNTYRCYAAGLWDLIQPLDEFLLEQENVIKSQTKAYTIMTLTQNIEKKFSYLKSIHYIHQSSVLDHTKSPAHICSAFLLTNLLTIQFSSSKKIANIAAALFLSSIKAFCYIIDAWWSDGRLDDWQNEFVIDNSAKKFNEVSNRLYSKNKEKAFFVSSGVSKIIQKNYFFKLLLSYCLEAGCTLNLLFQLHKVGNLEKSSSFKVNLYDSFVNDVLFNVALFKRNQKSTKHQSKHQQKHRNMSTVRHNLKENFLNEIEDDLLKITFKCNLLKSNSKKRMRKDEKNRNILNILQVLNSTSNLGPPLEEIICNSISNILQRKIACANDFVMNMYYIEFEVLKHLQNIRRVLLMESSDLIHIFYVKLFAQIESGKNWMNPFILTMQLDDIMCSRSTEMSAAYRIEFISDFKNQTDKVIEAVDELLVTYNFRKELANIISEASILQYNKIFRFLLKVKWGLWTLENLQFSKLYRKHLPPYAEFKIEDLLMRRLQQIRFWIMYCIQCIHFYLMVHVIQVMSFHFNTKMKNCNNLAEMRSVHDSYIDTICKFCFICDSGENHVKVAIEQLLNLIYVLKLKWHNCISNNVLENTKLDINCKKGNDNYILLTEIDAIESTYIQLHQFLAKALNNEVYVNQQTHLSELSAAFNSNIPY